MHDRTLAINGGKPVIQSDFQLYRSIKKEERDALVRVAESGCLSGFYGSWGSEFYGGPEVKAFEKAWCTRFGTRYAVSVNSNTSGLVAALGAIGLGPGDEVIVPPLTMSATVVCPLLYGGIPVFADVSATTFCLDVDRVREKITNRTKAVIAVNLFGHPAPLRELRELCDRHSIYLIEDNAQAPLATQDFRLTGTVGDIGVFSLNYHKHIHTGEGGVCVTNDELLAIRLQAIRNHAENIVEPCSLSPVNMIGFNFRMTEMSAAVGLAQLDKIDAAVERRKVLAEKLSEAVAMHDGIEAPVCMPNCSHVYYIWAARIKEDELGISRESFSKALAAEGFPHFLGYVRPLYYLPTFQSRQAIGSEGWPFTLSTQEYIPGMCPVAESLFTNELLCFETCAYELGPDEIELLIEAINKVYSNRSNIIE